jgi:hypothetical protein
MTLKSRLKIMLGIHRILMFMFPSYSAVRRPVSISKTKMARAKTSKP